MLVAYRPFVHGKGWTSHAALRAKTLIVEDSVPYIRAERDSGP
jgi:hypothetical protein